MTGLVIPFETHQTTTRVWVAWWNKRARPALGLRVRLPDQTVVREFALDGGWSSIGLEGPGNDEVVCEYQVLAVDGLAPATSYELVLFQAPAGDTLRTGYVETLPDRLPDPGGTDLANRPFTIMLGSCYYAPADPHTKVDEAHSLLWNSPTHRPHLKILTGDQVYLDQPAGPGTPMVDRMSSEELRRWMIAKYRRAWLNLQNTLRAGANYMTSDDHEFWNNYPERPLIWGWRALYQHLQYRRDWGREATAHFREIQQGADTTQLDIGDELSIFIADTRVNRQRDGVHFMSAESFDTMVEWIRSLRSPGVLVLGQPVLARPTNRKQIAVDVITTDHNLPFFVQYDDLVSALSWWCYHDLLILAGDVHFGRIARFSIPRSPDIYPATAYEVVSSGMTVLPTAKGTFDLGPGGRGFPDTFPPYRNRYYNSLGAHVTYEQVVPRQTNDDSGTENHFMTLQFTRHPLGRGIEVKVHAWLVDRERDHARKLPASAWTYTCSLDVLRPSSAIAMIAPPVVDLGEVRRGELVTRDRILTVSSVGPVPLVVQAIRVEGDQSSAFTVTPHSPRPLPVTLQPGESFPLSVRFQSAGVGEHEARAVLVAADLVGAPLRVDAVLLADVVAPDMIVLPTAVNFGQVELGQQPTRNIIVSSYGSAPLRFRVEPLAPAGPFSWSGDAPNTWRTLEPGTDAIVAVRYAPTTVASHTASVVVTSDDETVSVTLGGAGVAPPRPEIRATPRQINFGVVSVGTTGTQQLAVANDGTGALAIRAATIQGPDSKLFALAGRAPSPLTPIIVKAGQSHGLGVTFTPARIAGARQATLVIESNADNTPQLSVSLTGTAAIPNLEVKPAQIAFNPSPLAATLPPGLGSTRGLDIYNTGAAALTITGSSFRVLDAASGQVSPHFTLVNPAGQPFPQSNLQLAAGAFQSLSVLFRPVTAGNHAARIVIAATDRGQPPVTVSITGQGIG